MWNFLAPPAHKQELPAEKIDSAYKSYRWQVFLGIFIGYAGFYIVRKNFSMAIPELAQFGFEKGELSIRDRYRSLYECRSLCFVQVPDGKRVRPQ